MNFSKTHKYLYWILGQLVNINYLSDIYNRKSPTVGSTEIQMIKKHDNASLLQKYNTIVNNNTDKFKSLVPL